ncbi:hypothetical protein AB0N07_33300 [Streptomyces sp. NPDC051172]|uniref:hypothetical protein n=1 Tax=Streptomyces sp. NPDC051172 TaxID=3155796 RepID=UPI0034249A89
MPQGTLDNYNPNTGEGAIRPLQGGIGEHGWAFQQMGLPSDRYPLYLKFDETLKDNDLYWAVNILVVEHPTDE